MEKRKTRIALMWAVIIAGFAIHTLVDLMPLFWNVPVAADSSGSAPYCMLALMAVLCYTLPVAGLLVSMFVAGRCGAGINLVLAAVMLLFNLIHTGELICTFDPVQLFILPMILLVSILLFADSLMWWRAVSR